MTTRPAPIRFLSVAMTVALVLGACSSDDSPIQAAESSTTESTTPPTTSTAAETTTSTAVEQTAPPSEEAAALMGEFNVTDGLDLVNGAFIRGEDVWPGFDPNNEPIVLALKAGGELRGALAINHPDPEALGDLTPLSVDNAVFASAYLVTNPVDADRLSQVAAFEFHTTLGGVDSFVMIADQSDDFFALNSDDYGSTLVHEVFHRWQDEGFQGGIGGQDVEGYAYTAENLALAALEERAMTQAFEAASDAELESAARSVAAVRLIRLKLDDRVRLDNDQERFEGTARYLEHQTNGTEGPGVYNASNFDGELVTSPTAAFGVKEHYGFGRFYSTGAAILNILDQLGVDGVGERINAGASPAEVLIEEMAVTPENAQEIVEETRSALDPLNQLAAAGTEAADQAAGEPPVFGDVPGAPGGEEGESSEGSEVITSEELDCLVENGLDLSDENAEISEEIFEACLAGTSS